MKERGQGVGGHNRRCSGWFSLRVTGSVGGESQRNWIGIYQEEDRLCEWAGERTCSLHSRGREGSFPGDQPAFIRLGAEGKSQKRVDESVWEGREQGATQGDTEEWKCGYKAGVVAVVLVTGDCCEGTQKNEALFVHLYCDLQGPISAESTEQNSVSSLSHLF